MLTHHTIEETDEERMEEQTNVEEESVPQKKPEYYKYVDYWQIIVKFTELGLCIAGCVFLTKSAFITFQSKLGETIVETSFVGGLVSTSVFILVYFWNEDRHLMEIITLFIYGVLNAISSILIVIEKLHTEEQFGNYFIVALIAGLTGVIMVADFILCILCTALIIDPLNSKNIWPMYQHHISFIFATICGYIIIISVALLGRLFGDRLPFKTSAFFSLLGSGLFLTAGCIILSDRTHFSRSIVFHPNRYLLDMMSTSGVIAILNSLTFSLDAIFTLRLQNDL